MKNGILILLLVAVALTGFSQNAKYKLPERQNPTANKEKLNQAKILNDISPLLWSNLSMQMAQRYFLDKRRPDIYPQPENYQYPQDNYRKILDVFMVKITGTHNGKTVTAQSKNDKLTEEQKQILSTADLGSDINIILQFKYKNQKDDSYGPRNLEIQGEVAVTVVPNTEAAFPGGHTQLSDYFVGNVINKVTQKELEQKVDRAIVKFIVNENGEVTDAKIARTSSDPKIDKLLLDAIDKMPKWSPAVDANGVRVKQEVSIPFGMMGGC